MNELSSIRPWGKWEMLDEGIGYWVKKITVSSGQRLSLQYHLKRKEKWIIVQGEAHVTLDNSITTAFEGALIEIPYRAIHRIANKGVKPLIFIEVALGVPLEEDIIRIEDDYKRE